jgi:hypothetical protein
MRKVIAVPADLARRSGFRGEVEMGKYRISFLAGFAAGFMVGARAGRERYEQIMKAARAVAEQPAVQQAAGAIQAQATSLASAAGSRISDEVKDRAPQLARSAKSATARVAERVPGLRGHGADAGENDEAGHDGHRPAGNGSMPAMSRRDGTVPGE